MNSKIDKFKRGILCEAQKGNMIGKIEEFFEDTGGHKMTRIKLQNGEEIVRRRMSWHQLGKPYFEQQNQTGRGAIPF